MAIYNLCTKQNLNAYNKVGRGVWTQEVIHLIKLEFGILYIVKKNRIPIWVGNYEVAKYNNNEQRCKQKHNCTMVKNI